MTTDDRHIPLYVDLDGTLIKGDMLYESSINLLKSNILHLFRLPGWLLKGKAALKSAIARRSHIKADALPVNAEFLHFLQQEAEAGRAVILTTAADRRHAREAAGRFPFFTGVLSSDGEVNLSGPRKLAAIQAQCQDGEFDYAGNALIDGHIFKHARHSILVNCSAATQRVLERSVRFEHVFDPPPAALPVFLKAIRLHQWLKNLLVFVPLFASHNWFNTDMIGRSVLAFLAFGLCASGTYLFNDLMDIEVDRRDENKKDRPLANGDLSVLTGTVAMLLLPLAGIALACFISPPFVGALAVYLIVNILYTLVLKTYVLIDILTLAGLYTVRVIAGGLAIGVELSFWLLTFSMFMFLNLALVKRCSEVMMLIKKDVRHALRRDYQSTDLVTLQCMGVASGFLSVLIIALYINGPDVMANYRHPKLLWLLCPALLYWVGRVWLKTGRDEMHHDPLMFALTDRASYVIGVFVVLIIVFAS